MNQETLIPRFYIYQLEAQGNLLAELKRRKFLYEEVSTPVQFWNYQITDLINDPKVTIEKVTEENYEEALYIEGSIKEFGGIETIEKVFREQFNHPAFIHYLLRYEGTACSTACMFKEGDQARIESAATVEGYRGKGLIGQLIQFIQKEAKTREIKKFWIFPINESVEKVYEKYGFRTVQSITMGHAFLRGKSIKEIQG